MTARRRRALRVVLALAAVYLVGLAMLTAIQRALLFPAPPALPVPAGRGALIDSRDASGTRFVAHHTPARAGSRTLVFFHGNGDQLASVVDLAEPFARDGLGFYAVEYPGYGPLAGERPSEAALLASADAALGHLRNALGVPAAQTVLIGQSLGTGVATEMARRGRGARVVLLSPFLSIADVAAAMIPWAPVRGLVRDRFDSAARAPGVSAPVLVIHGDRDELIPAAQGERLARIFPHGRYLPVRGAGHNDLWHPHGSTVLGAIRSFARE